MYLATFQVFFIIPCLDIYQKIDMRTATYDVPPQEVAKDPSNPLFHPNYTIMSNNLLQILTKDSVTVFVNAIMYYKVNHKDGEHHYSVCAKCG